MLFFKKQSEEEQKNKAIAFGVWAGIVEALYIAWVVFFLNLAESLLPSFKLNQFFAPMLMLLIFVISVGISGLVVFGYPAHLAFRKEFKPAVIAASSALITMVVISFLIAVIGSLVY